MVVLLFFMSCLSAILVSTPFLNLQKRREFSWVFKVGFLKKLAIKTFFNLRLALMNKNQNEEEEKKQVEAEDIISLLDLQDLPLECILERLSPSGLCSMAGVCISLRERSISDHLWEKHMKQKWGKLISSNAAAYQQWQKHKASRKRVIKQSEAQWQKGFFGYFSSFLFGVWNVGKANDKKIEKRRSCLPEDSVMAWYLAIETGKFWFPAQVLNRENSHVGFMLSCYDAEVSYDSNTDTFVGRFLANGRRTIEDNIGWNRIRAPTTSTPANVLHISDCLNDLRPGDHIEIQWRKSKEFPYGWWYVAVGHLESCNGIESLCQCSRSDIVVLEFKQYGISSRWRKTLINRKDHGEVGNEGDGFYGGIRKLTNELEISMWKSLCLTCTL